MGPRSVWDSEKQFSTLSIDTCEDGSYKLNITPDEVRNLDPENFSERSPLRGKLLPLRSSAHQKKEEADPF